jgi:hypothetical protein
VVVQLVRIPACHAGGRGFESRPLRHIQRGARKWAPFCLLAALDKSILDFSEYAKLKM